MQESSVYKIGGVLMDDLYVIELRDAETRFPELIGRVEDGEEILITRGDRPAAILGGLTDDFAAEDDLIWEGEIQLTADAECAGEVSLFASIARYRWP